MAGGRGVCKARAGIHIGACAPDLTLAALSQTLHPFIRPAWDGLDAGPRTSAELYMNCPPHKHSTT